MIQYLCMGIISTLADLGSIGSTTKWVLKSYETIKSKNKKLKDVEIYQIMMIERYRKIEITPPEKYNYYSGDKFMVYQGQIAEYHAGLTGLVIEILNVEADLWKNNVKALDQLLKPLSQRMLKEKKLSKKSRFGEMHEFIMDDGIDMKWMNFIMSNYERVENYGNIDPNIKEDFYNKSLKLYEKFNS